MEKPDTISRSRSRMSCALLAGTITVALLGTVKGRHVLAAAHAQGQSQPVAAGPLVIQGRITGIQGTLATVKTPNGYPGGPSVHAQFVIAGPTFRVNISHARILLPDGKRFDELPLAVGDRVLMVLSEKDSGSPAPDGSPDVNQIHFASVIERIVQSDTMVTH